MSKWSKSIWKVTSDDEYAPGCDGKLSIEEWKELGMLFATQEEVCIAVKVSYIMEYKELDESEWPAIISNLHARWVIGRKTIKDIFKRMRDGDQNAKKQRKGAGCPCKLNKDNAGLIAAAAALNNGTPPKLAVYICNAINEKKHPKEYNKLKICHKNTLMVTLESLTDFQENAIPQ